MNMMRLWLGSAGACFLLAFLAPPVDAQMYSYTGVNEGFDSVGSVDVHSKFDEDDLFGQSSSVNALDGYTDGVLLEHPEDAEASESQLEETSSMETSIYKSRGFKKMAAGLTIFLLFVLVCYLDGRGPSESVDDKSLPFRVSRKILDFTESLNTKFDSWSPIPPDVDAWILMSTLLLFSLGTKQMVDGAVRKRDLRKGHRMNLSPPVEGVFLLAIGALSMVAGVALPYMLFFMSLAIPSAVLGLLVFFDSLVKRYKFRGKHQAAALRFAEENATGAEGDHEKKAEQML